MFYILHTRICESILPVFVPPVNIHAPVDRAAFKRPFLRTFFSLGCSSKFALPPWIDMRSLGSSKFHSRVINCMRCSGLVSCATLIYWKKKKIELISYSEMSSLIQKCRKNMDHVVICKIASKNSSTSEAILSSFTHSVQSGQYYHHLLIQL